MKSANDPTYDDLVLFFSAGNPPQVRDAINPFTLLSWKQVGNELQVISQVMDDEGKPQERSMRVVIRPNNEHALRTLRSWLPSGGKAPLKRAGDVYRQPPGGE